MSALTRRNAVRLQCVVLAGVVLAGLGRVLTYLPPEPPPTAHELWQRLLVARSARVALTVDVAVAERRVFRLSATGVFETAAGRTALRVSSSGLATGEVTYDEVVAGPSVHVRPANGRWYTFLDVAESPRRPAGLLVLLADAGPLRRVGSEQVRGVGTTRYTAAVRGGALDVWADADRLPRRLAFQQGGSVSSVDLYDFLLAEPVVVPAGARPVADLADALRRGTA